MRWLDRFRRRRFVACREGSPEAKIDEQARQAEHDRDAAEARDRLQRLSDELAVIARGREDGHR
jgi:hypothetical protein